MADVVQPPVFSAVKIRIGQVFRVPGTDYSRPDSYVTLTKGQHASCADIQKGIWAYKGVAEPKRPVKRIPAVLLHSNPFKEGTESTPWVDIVEPDEGYAIYNGDNRRSCTGALEARGNALLGRLQDLYHNPTLRKLAPPLLLFTQKEIVGNTKGYRQFAGYGIPTRYALVSHKEKNSDRYFTNLVIEIALFRLDAENEHFDWAWIDLRRDPRCSAESTLRAAPAAWDKYPVVLVNGKPLARELRLLLNEEGITLRDVLTRERRWYEPQVQPVGASRILGDVTFDAAVTPAQGADE